MKVILVVLVLIMAGLAYFEYTGQQQIALQDHLQLSSLQEKIDAMTMQSKKGEQEKADLNQKVAEAQAQIGQLNGQLQEAQKQIQALTPKPAPLVKAPAAPVVAPNTNNLGNITTLVGTTYQSCHLLKVEADGITISDADGIRKIMYAFLPLALQKRFGFDPHVAPQISAAEVDHQEQMRQALPP